MSSTMPTNSDAPAYRLPGEIISSILLSHRNLCLRDPDTSGPNAVPWISPSQTCSLWRAAALECCTLWDTLLLYNTEATKALLSRSKDVPIHVGWNRSAPTPANPFNWMAQTETISNSLVSTLKHSQRIATLNTWMFFLIDWEQSADQIMSAFLGAAFPALRSLDVIGGTIRPTPALCEWLACFVSRLIEPPSCALSHISLDNCPPSAWSMLKTSTLRRLQWCGADGYLPYLMPVLESNPTLESITVNTSSRQGYSIWPTHPPFSLPRLQEFILVGILPTGILHVLDGVNANPAQMLAMIELPISHWSSNIEQLASVVKHISSMLAHSSKTSPQILRSAVYQLNPRQDQVQFARSSRPHPNVDFSLNSSIHYSTGYRGLRDWSGDTVFSLEMDPQDPDDFDAVPKFLHCLLPFVSHIETIYLDLSKFHPGRQIKAFGHWMEYSATFETLKRLEIFFGEHICDSVTWPSLEEVSIVGSELTRESAGFVLKKLVIKRGDEANLTRLAMDIDIQN
ncbi:hypothetical protein DL96DRAFT_1625619 [Flagelloscypha sp. PMI_526]|nr:hypothetical protein DL96DRAFT_1625619 [Flagelloscypha sp. PMI_526]